MEFMSELSEADRIKIIDAIEIWDFKRGQIIFDSNENWLNSIFVVYSGEIDTVRFIRCIDQDKEKTRLPLNRLLAVGPYGNRTSKVIKQMRVIGRGNMIGEFDHFWQKQTKSGILEGVEDNKKGRFKAVWKTFEATLVKIDCGILSKALENNSKSYEIVKK